MEENKIPLSETEMEVIMIALYECKLESAGELHDKLAEGFTRLGNENKATLCY